MMPGAGIAAGGKKVQQMQNVLVVGAGGQLGRELVRTAGTGVTCAPLHRSDLDVSDAAAVASTLEREQPHLVINASAYTAVDGAETESELAYRVNAEGPGHLALACREQGVRLIHVSTDFVFDGSASRPYPPDAVTAPLGEYGRSKRAGELAVQAALPDALIFRTGWVYSVFGGNFVKTMLRLMAEREELAVVADQVGTPTWARGLARALWRAAERPGLAGVYHWSDAGVCSWYDFAVAIFEEASALGMLSRPVKIRPIPTSEYPTPAERPAYSVLDKAGSWRDLDVEGIHWRQQLRAMLEELKEMEYV
jgi:dTDP-4-dehydrorhamnose reductase